MNQDPSQPLRTIADLHARKTGKVSNKWSSYLTYYDQLFAGLKDAPIKLLEIGVQNGGSLETWARYFEKAALILGCDVDEKCRNLRYEDPRIGVMVGDANSQAIFGALQQSAPFDVIIDDGSHQSEDILISFLNYFPLVQPGGIYVVEDTHAIYQRSSTRIHNKLTALGFFKDLTDVVNFQFWQRDLSIEALLGPYLKVPVPHFLNEGWVDAVEFRNSVITIRKAAVPGHQKVGYMHIVGDTADVDAEPLRVRQLIQQRT